MILFIRANQDKNWSFKFWAGLPSEKTRSTQKCFVRSYLFCPVLSLFQKTSRFQFWSANIVNAQFVFLVHLIYFWRALWNLFQYRRFTRLFILFTNLPAPPVSENCIHISFLKLFPKSFFFNFNISFIRKWFSKLISPDLLGNYFLAVVEVLIQYSCLFLN